MGNQLKLLRFSPCYKSGGGIDIDRKDTFPQRGETKEYDNTSYQPPLAANGKYKRWQGSSNPEQKMFVEGQEVHPMTEYSDYAEPIILNEEWLLKLGFTKYSTGSWCKNLKNDDSYLAIDVKYGNGTWLNINQEGQENTIKLIHIKNVHELQNLYYALTGVELSAS